MDGIDDGLHGEDIFARYLREVGAFGEPSSDDAVDVLDRALFVRVSVCSGGDLMPPSDRTANSRVLRWKFARVLSLLKNDILFNCSWGIQDPFVPQLNKEAA